MITTWHNRPRRYDIENEIDYATSYDGFMFSIRVKKIDKQISVFQLYVSYNSMTKYLMTGATKEEVYQFVKEWIPEYPRLETEQ